MPLFLLLLLFIAVELIRPYKLKRFPALGLGNTNKRTAVDAVAQPGLILPSTDPQFISLFRPQLKNVAHPKERKKTYYTGRPLSPVPPLFSLHTSLAVQTSSVCVGPSVSSNWKNLDLRQWRERMTMMVIVPRLAPQTSPFQLLEIIVIHSLCPTSVIIHGFYPIQK